ncbi:MAG: 2-succinyl-5-enolpyruvyl-6-hydroxy-3-cyclohexene-1-carboxylate synthase, partial [Spirochaetia bacterium]|nr:2-succinyl-5-enolpyruvyl-6-hydroxy-3-cyclohexene-1-carboxylate synthase [Spirochaetia bacterium]
MAAPSDILARNVASAELACEWLVRLGVTHLFASPGSRNSTLLLAAHRNQKLKTLVHFDERGMAFAALGAAKAGGRPVAILVTSGTAVANLFPALLEAEAAGLPLIFISADRPPEAHGIGANQTVDQKNIFGAHVKNFFLLKPSDDGEAKNTFVQITHTFEEAVRVSLTEPRGPIHIN